jgi:hypothetical protein
MLSKHEPFDAISVKHHRKGITGDGFWTVRFFYEDVRPDHW